LDTLSTNLLNSNSEINLAEALDIHLKPLHLFLSVAVYGTQAGGRLKLQNQKPLIELFLMIL
jgi:hypothetical protein